MKLSTYTQNKDNNFNLIRIIAALAVLFGHSSALLGQSEPMAYTLGMSIGSIAVDIFFIASGFLVTGSLLSRQNLRDYFFARILRIYPALLVMLMLTVLGLGGAMTSLSVNAYFHHTQLLHYFHKCLSLISGAAYFLPGVFENNPYRAAVNGSLWSMVYELRMYFLLAFFWIVCRFSKTHTQRNFERVILVSTLIACVLTFYEHFSSGEVRNSTKLFFMFFSGASFWIMREKISVNIQGAVFGISLLIMSAVWSTDAFFCAYQLSIAYILFGIAYLPSGLIRRYNRLGDYSYGVYIYAFPIQQTLIALIPEISPLILTVLATILTLVCAILSWHLIERPALDLKKRYFKQAQSLLTSPT